MRIIYEVRICRLASKGERLYFKECAEIPDFRRGAVRQHCKFRGLRNLHHIDYIIRIFTEAIRKIRIFKTSSDYSLLPRTTKTKKLPERVGELFSNQSVIHSNNFILVCVQCF